MKRFFGNGLVQLAILVTIVFVMLELMYGDPIVRVGAESMRLAVYAVLASLTFKVAWQSFWAPRPRSSAQIVAMALGGMATMIAVHAMWIPVSKYVSMPDWFPKSEVTSAIILGIAMAGLTYMVPVSRSRFVATGPAVASWISVFVAGTLTGTILSFFLFNGLSF